MTNPSPRPPLLSRTAMARAELCIRHLRTFPKERLVMALASIYGILECNDADPLAEVAEVLQGLGFNAEVQP